jgi:methionyl-tRNA formyltransferase
VQLTSTNSSIGLIYALKKIFKVDIITNMNCLFLGYSEKKTCLIKFLKNRGLNVKNKSRHLNKSDLLNNDIYFSFGYKQILPKNILKFAKRPIINLHMSYLPYNRGAHPNFWSFVNKTPSGVSIHEIDGGIDSGPIIYQKKFKFDYKRNKNLTFKFTYNSLFKELEKLFKKKINFLISQKYMSKKQKKIYPLNKKKDLPNNLKSWNIKIYNYIKLNG